MPEWLPRQRWFGAKDSTITGVKLVPLGELEVGTHALIAADVSVGGETQRYLLPLSAFWSDNGEENASASAPVLARITCGDRSGVLVDSALDPSLAKALLGAMRRQDQLAGEGGEVAFLGSDTLRKGETTDEPRPLGAEQSNVSIAFGSSVILKLYRRLRAGEQPDVEVARFLSHVGHFANAPEFLGEIQFRPNAGEATTTLAAAFAFVPNQGDAWSSVTDALTQDLRDGKADFSSAAMIGAILGQRTAELHRSLSVPTNDPDFAVEPLRPEDVAGWAEEAVAEAEDLLGRLEGGLSGLPANAHALADEVLGKRDTLIALLRAASGMTPSGGRSRIHGDYHLGQVLVTGDDVMIIDFEGEPKRSLPERRAKSSPLRDVAGMLRSFHYAAFTALGRYAKLEGGVPDAVRERSEDWSRRVSDDFLRAFRQHVVQAPSYPSDPVFAQALTDLFLLQKAVYEIGYELANRPDWVEIPLSGVRDLLVEA